MTTSNLNAIALFGGTFDPIHLGHIKPMIAAANDLHWQKVILLPANIPPHKAHAKVSAKHRLAMLKLVCQDFPIFDIDDRELYKNSPSFTVETLTEYRLQYPTAQLYFGIGMDSLLSFTQWHKWQEILALTHLVVSDRPGYTLDNMDEFSKQKLSQHIIDSTKTPLSHVESLAGNIIILPSQQYDISSTMIRQQLLQRSSITSLTTPKVSDYINQHNLYR